MIIIIHFFFFFFNDTATTEIYTLSLHDALPIWNAPQSGRQPGWTLRCNAARCKAPRRDRKSTRLNSSHLVISYAVFCLKKKKTRENVGSEAQPSTFNSKSMSGYLSSGMPVIRTL